MEFRKRVLASGFVGCLAIALIGCEPSGQSAADDEKEPHYILGQTRVSAMDFQGAIEAFEASLEANPHSGAAHFQLAILYDEKEPNPAAAIYHYQQYLRLDPNARNVEVITQRIYTCKQQLAADVLPLPSSPAAQQQLQQLADKNRQLQQEVDKWQAYYKSNLAENTNLLSVTENSTQPNVNPTQPLPAVNTTPPVTKPRTHVVVARETPAGIARKYGVSVNALLAVNPGLNPKKLRVGQLINLPPT